MGFGLHSQMLWFKAATIGLVATLDFDVELPGGSISSSKGSSSGISSNSRSGKSMTSIGSNGSTSNSSNWGSSNWSSSNGSNWDVRNSVDWGGMSSYDSLGGVGLVCGVVDVRGLNDLLDGVNLVGGLGLGRHGERQPHK